MEQQTSSLQIGQRIHENGSIGTVRFYGLLSQNQEDLKMEHRGFWVGIEWDEEGRGKHDGVFQGIHLN